MPCMCCYETLVACQLPVELNAVVLLILKPPTLFGLCWKMLGYLLKLCVQPECLQKTKLSFHWKPLLSTLIHLAYNVSFVSLEGQLSLLLFTETCTTLAYYLSAHVDNVLVSMVSGTLPLIPDINYLHSMIFNTIYIWRVDFFTLDITTGPIVSLVWEVHCGNRKMVTYIWFGCVLLL